MLNEEQAAGGERFPAALTDEQIDALWTEHIPNGMTGTEWRRRFARAIIRAAASSGASDAPQALTVEAVAVVGPDGELDWLIEGGPGAMEPGEVLMICAERLTDDTGSGEVYRTALTQPAAEAPKVEAREGQLPPFPKQTEWTTHYGLVKAYTVEQMESFGRECIRRAIEASTTKGKS